MKKWHRLLRYDWPLHFALVLTNWMPDNIPFLKFRGFLASFFVKKAGKNLQLGRNITLYDPSKITFGDNVYIAKGAWFSCSYGIEISNNVLFGPNVVIVTSNHSIKDDAYYWGSPVNCQKVIIKDGTWIGAHTTLLPGTVVEKCVLLAANSVLSGGTMPYGIYGGTPAKLIKYATP